MSISIQTEIATKFSSVKWLGQVVTPNAQFGIPSAIIPVTVNTKTEWRNRCKPQNESIIIGYFIYNPSFTRRTVPPLLLMSWFWSTRSSVFCLLSAFFTSMTVRNISWGPYTALEISFRSCSIRDSNWNCQFEKFTTMISPMWRILVEIYVCSEFLLKFSYC